MRTWRAFIASLILAFVVLSAQAGHRATQRIITGTVSEFHAGEWMSVAYEGADPEFRIGLRKTAYEGSPSAIKRGVRETVAYRAVGERRPVADYVRLLPQQAAP